MNHKRKSNLLVLLITTVTVLGLGFLMSAMADEDTTPSHNKSLTVNKDGTYEIALDVTGSADTTSSTAKANILIIYDRSGSMAWRVQSRTGDYATSHDTGYSNSKLYRRNNYNQCVQVSATEDWTGTVYTSNNCYTVYTGNRYSSAVSRGAAAEKTVYDFATKLYNYNTTAEPNNVQMALVTFSGSASTTQNWTNNKNTYLNHFASSGTTTKLNYNGGTNWEASLDQALTVLGSADKDPTFVVFVTDGGPTYSTTSGDGTEVKESFYRAAIDEALDIQNYNTSTHTSNAQTRNTQMYGIYAFGDDSDYLDDLIYYAHNGKERKVSTDTDETPFYYNANDSEALNAAVDEIFANIIETSGVGSVSITDGTTNAVSTSTGDFHLLKVDESTYKYWLSMPVTGSNGTYRIVRKDIVSGKDYTITITDNEDGTFKCDWTDSKEKTHSVTVTGTIKDGVFKYQWTGKNDLYDFDPPVAKLNGSSVDWDLSKLGTLLDGVTYTVTFDAWPTQDTYDLISDLKNGIKTYDSLDANIKKYLLPDDNGGYTLRTNTSATLKYTDTRNSEGEQTVGYKNPDPVETPASEMTVKKIWDNALDKRTTDKINLNVTKDKSKYGETLELSNSTTPAWSSKVFISTGFMSVTKDDKGNPTKAIIRESGHDYTFKEVGDESYYWDLVVETVRPMIINGALTNLVKVEENAPEIGDSNVLVQEGVTYYKIGNSVYYVREQNTAIMNATNNRRSNLNINKIVTGEAPADSEFTFTVKVDDYLENDVWFSIYDNNASATVMDETVVSGNVTKEIKDGSFTGYYHAPTGTTITMKLKANWNVRFTNLPTGSTYTIEETSMPEGFIFDESKGTKVSISVDLLPSDATANADGTYTSNNVIYTPVKDAQGNITHYTYEGDVTKTGRKIEGEIYVSNTSYQAIYTNEYTLTNVTATKVWDDDNNRAGFRSNELNVTLSRNGETINTQVLNDTNKWTYTWKNLPKFDTNGVEYRYTVTEGEVNSKYSTKYEGKVSYDVKAKPTSDTDVYTVELLANGNSTGKTVTLNKANNWTSSINNVDYIDKNGNIITYTTSLDNVRLYSQDKNITITNSYTPETVDIPVKKIWNDADNQDGIRPASVTVQLQANGTNVTDKTATITSANNWTYTFEDLDKYLNGSEVRYTVVETPVEGYTTTYSEDTLTITNTHEPEKFDYEVEKKWRDDNNRDGLRPEEITVKLIDDEENEVKSIKVKASENWAGKFEDVPKYKNGELVTYTVVETAPNGYTASYSYNAANTKATINNIHDPEPTSVTVTKTWSDNNNQDGIRPSKITVKLLANGTEVDSAIVIPNADGNWTYTFSDLNKKENGVDIVYTITENTVPGYTTVIDGTSITNTLTSPEKTSLTVTKEWVDNNNQDNLRTPITVKLLKDGKTTDKSITLNETNNWTATFTDLDKNRDGGTPIIYTVEEVSVEGYTTTIDYNKTTATITNTLTNPEKTTFTVEKVWNDDNNRDGLRKELTVHLYADNKDTGKTAKLNEDNHYTATFTDLDKNNNGTPITYTVVEDAITGYTTTYDYKTKENTGIITNTHTIEKTKLDVSKVWNDDNNRDNLRTATVKVTLVKNGTPTDKTLTLSATNDWSDSFTNLEKNENGALITYTVQETTIEGYTPSYNCSETACIITNTHTSATTTFTVTKVWDDDNNRDGIRPTSLLFTLYADGNQTDESVTLNQANNWTYTFTDLPTNNQGKKIVYSVKEANVTGYTSNVALTEGSAIVTNKHVSEDRTITVTKLWADNNNQDGIRPDTITVNLLANGEVDKTAKLTEENDWSYTFSNLPKNKDGKLITYTVQELRVEGYTTTINGFEITNTLTNPEKTAVEGEKVWADNNNQDGIRPEKITVNLLADGEKVDSQTVTANNNWKYSFTNLDKNKAGKEIVYTVTENKVEGYTTTIEGTTITNTLTNPEKTKLDVEKVWKDNNNQDNLRSESIEVILVKNGTETTNTLTLNEENSWKGAFSNLDKNENGKLITYTVKEVSVEGYTTAITYDNTKATITNTLTDPEKTAVEGEKVWADNNNQDGIRPEKITVNLLADGEKVDSQTVTANNNWKYSFTNLDKNKAGKEIVYTVTENKVEGYTTTIEGTTITNTLTNPEKTKLDVEKVWKDNNNQDNLRSESIEVILVKNGTETTNTLTLNEENSWKGTFSNLDKNENGKLITYTVKEVSVEGYTTAITYDNTKATITNTLTDPEKTAVEGEKVWADNNNQDGIRPEKITVNLLADGEKVDSQTVTAKNNWKYSFTNLDKNKAGKEIVYTVTENKVEGYTTTIEETTITNTLTNPEKTKLDVEKVWNDKNNQDGVRPTSIEVTLYADGVDTGKTLTLNEENSWKGTFSDLDKNKAGKAITYTVEENELSNYERTITYDNNKATIVNRHNVEKTSVEGTKTWIDNDNQDDIRPTKITVNLYADGVKVDSKTVEETNGTWTYSFTDLDKNNNGKEIVYTIKETSVEGYTTTYDGFNITNTHNPYTTSITGTKTWKDNNNQDGIRPEKVTVRLLADGEEVANTTVSSETDWNYSFSNLPKYNDGKKITYTISEDEVEGYTTRIFDYDITNIHQSETTEVSGTKTWVDNDNQDGIRPERIIINLLANGEKVDNKVVREKNGTWEYSFTDLPKYENGEEITYTIEEVPVDGYTTTIDGLNITNTHEVGTTSVTGTKTWKDTNNQDGLRPESITVRLYADGKEVASTTATASSDWTYTFSNLPKYNNGKKITYTVSEDEVPGYTTKISDYDITNTHKPEIIEVSGTKTWNDNNNQDGIRPESIIVRLYANGERIDSKIVRETNGTWTYKFTDLPKYENGKEIVYTVSEKEVDGYTTTIDGYNITNTYEPETTTVTGTKTWKDNNNQDGLRPDSITVRLYADGKEVANTTASAESDWNYTFSNLPKYNNGKKITYTISEDTIPEYATKIEDFDIINTHKPGTTNIVGTKTWDDNNNQDGIRPERINVYLYANGEQIDKKVVTEKNGTWTYTFTDLPKYENGKEIVYTVSEKEVDGYTTAIDGYNIINTLTNPETTKIDATKVWNDNNNQDGIRPEKITVTLYADNAITDKQLVLSEYNNWTGQFVDLDKNKEGKTIAYTVKETEIEGYTGKVTCKKTTCTIENTLTNPEKIDIEGEKIWEDNNNQDGIRPDKVTISLYADGEKINTAVVTNKTNWKYTFTDLDKNKEGKAIVYTVKETPVTGYTTTIDGFTITNTHEKELTSITGTKTWKDNNNQDGIRPESVTVRLYADGTEVASTTATSESDWNYSFTNLPKYNDGKKITYTITEDEVEGYTTKITDYDITNTHTPETVEINGTKTWVDENNTDGLRPSRITINLLADGEKVDTTTTNNSKEWKYSFKNLPKYNSGKEITYTVEEVPVEGYEVTVDGFNITNTHKPGTTSVTGTKTWKDNNNQDGIRPESITINLLANGSIVASQEIDNTTNWKYTFANLAEYKDGKKINYTVEEISIEGYVTTIDGYNIINTHKPELTTITGTKTWADDNNRDGIRPNRITVYLYADNTKIDTTVVTPDEEGNWNYTFDNLPKYKNGEEINYTVSEKEVKGYKASVDGVNITNTHEFETKDITGTKTWNDDNNRDGLRPESITIHLYADEVEVATTTATAKSDWKYTFSNLPVYKDGELITYSISEDEVAGYTGEVNGSNITNTHTPITKDITITKQWVDNDNQDNIRPNSIHINLYANGSLVKSADITSEDIKNNLWSYTFTDLPVNENGKEINYTITEDKVANYDTTIEGFNIINTHNPNKIHIKGEKTWDDESNIYGRPESIKVTLKRSVGEKTFEPITKEVTEKDDWKYDFGEFPEYYEGKLITYQVEEEAVRDYTTVIDGYNIKNTYTPETISISGTKAWDDVDNQDGIRPESITVELYANDSKVKETIASEESNWTYTFDNLVKYANGKEITYTVKEVSVDGYTTELTDYDITNHHTPETLTYNVRKVWEDYNNNDNLRPDFITVTLYKELTDGKKAIVEVVQMSEDNNWSYSFKELPRYYQGEEITYTIVEDTVYGYVTNISSEKIHDENTTKIVINSTIINTHEKEVTEVSGTKTWVDDDNYDGLRPESININLYANGELLETRSVTSEDNWTYSFKDLEKYHDGELIHYTIDEEDVFGYRKEIQNYNITNIHNHEVISISLKKTWVDNDDTNGLRPESIKVKLYADGEYLDTITITSANNWQYIINNLDKYKNGKIINYTIEEELVSEYTTIYDGYNIINIHNPGTGGDSTPPTPPTPPKKYIEVTPPKTGVNDTNDTFNIFAVIFFLLGILSIKRKCNN